MNALPGFRPRTLLRLSVPFALALLGLAGLACMPTISVGEKAVVAVPDHHKAVDIEKTPTTLNECATCHSDDGKLVASPTAPAIPHTTGAWQQCGFCHAPGRLAPVTDEHPVTADDACLNCHREAALQPPRMGHMPFTEKTCSSCHRAGTGIPVDHSTREDYVCTLCHQPPSQKPPEVPHPLVASPTCSSCHAGGGSNALPSDHSDRNESMCFTCHTKRPTSAPQIAHTLINRTDCVFCHKGSDAIPNGIQ